jgi:beta-lactamase class A
LDYSALEGRLDALRGRAGVLVSDADGSVRFARNADEPFPAASVIKLPLVMALFAEAARGSLDLEERIGVGERVGGSGVLAHLHLRDLTLRDHAVLTLIASDNTAANRVIERVGIDRVNGYLDGWGCPRSRLRRRMFDDDARARGIENEMTPRESAHLLAMLLRGELVDRATSDAVLEIMRAAAYDGHARRYLPSGVWTANKTGQLEGVRNDVAIVRVARPVILAAFTRDLAAEAEGEAALGLVGWFAYRESGGEGPDVPRLVA